MLVFPFVFTVCGLSTSWYENGWDFTKKWGDDFPKRLDFSIELTGSHDSDCESWVKLSQTCLCRAQLDWAYEFPDRTGHPNLPDRSCRTRLNPDLYVWTFYIPNNRIWLQFIKLKLLFKKVNRQKKIWKIFENCFLNFFFFEFFFLIFKSFKDPTIFYSKMFFVIFSQIRFWIFLRNDYYCLTQDSQSESGWVSFIKKSEHRKSWPWRLFVL